MCKESFDIELTTELLCSNRIIHMDGKIKEISDYLKNFKGEHHAIDTAINKLDLI